MMRCDGFSVEMRSQRRSQLKESQEGWSEVREEQGGGRKDPAQGQGVWGAWCGVPGVRCRGWGGALTAVLTGGDPALPTVGITQVGVLVCPGHRTAAQTDPWGDSLRP